MKIVALAALSLAAAGGTWAAEPLRLPPPGAVDPQAAGLNAEIRRIVDAEDIDALAALADPEVKLSFGGDIGRDRLRDWATEPWFWPEWRRITAHPPALHGQGEGALLAYPYFFADWPDPLDPFSHVVTGEGAALREQPNADAPAAATFDFAILQLRDHERESPEGWVWLCVERGACGYAEQNAVASPIDWRAVFLFEDGRWRMTAFVAGD